MPFLPASTLTPSPRSNFPRRAGAGVVVGEAAGVAGVEVEAEVAREAAVVAAAKGAAEVVPSSRLPAFRRNVVL